MKRDNLFQLFFELLEESTGAVLLFLLLRVVLSGTPNGLGFLSSGARGNASGYGRLSLSGGRGGCGPGRRSGVR